MINVVIPMAGAGSRFPIEEYKVPKPLIEIRGVPMIQLAIETLGIPGKYHFVIRRDEHLSSILSKLISIKPDCRVIVVDELTKGPACSALLFEKEIDNDDELVIANCDQIMEWDSELFLHNARYYRYDGMIVTYDTNTPKNSYARMNKSGLVQEVKEKEVISNISLNGIHYWRKGSYFVESANAMIKELDTAPNGEYYIGPSYNYMIRVGKTVGIHHIPKSQHHAVGVPEDLQTYLDKE
jgi:dTDP-glucose pyrophosphorylase